MPPYPLMAPPPDRGALASRIVTADWVFQVKEAIVRIPTCPAYQPPAIIITDATRTLCVDSGPPEGLWPHNRHSDGFDHISQGM